MSNPKKTSDSVKRESILKFVLMQNSKGNSDNIYSNHKFVNEYFDSDSEEEFVWR